MPVLYELDKENVNLFACYAVGGGSPWSGFGKPAYGYGDIRTKTQFTNKTLLPLTRNPYLPVNDVRLTRVELKRDGGAKPTTVEYVAGDWRWRLSGKNIPFSLDDVASRVSPPYSSFTQREVDLAYTQALSRVDLTSLEGGIALAELPETLHFLRNPLASLSKVMKEFVRDARKADRELRRKKFYRYRRQKYEPGIYAEAVADTWLSYRYAVRPLMGDISDCAQTIVNRAAPLQKMYSARGSHETDFMTIVDLPDTSLGLPYSWYWPTRFKYGILGRERRKVSFVVRYRPRLWMTDALTLAKWGISPTQLSSIVWELIPFSFVADWFWSFGAWLKAMEPKPHIEMVDTCRTYKWTHLYTYFHKAVQHGYSPVLGRIPDLDCWVKVSDMGRALVNAPTAPTPRLRSNGFRFLQALDAVSLSLKPILRSLRYVSKKL